jgi:acyl carrier protein
MSVRETVLSVFSEVARAQNRQLAPLTDDLPLLDSGIDSLCLAVIVANLEGRLGTDPFSSAEDIGVPATFGEFVALYENAVR